MTETEIQIKELKEKIKDLEKKQVKDEKLRIELLLVENCKPLITAIRELSDLEAMRVLRAFYSDAVEDEEYGFNTLGADYFEVLIDRVKKNK